MIAPRTLSPAILALAVAASAVGQQAATIPQITVSKETTYITEPLDADGLPDYRRTLLERYRASKLPPEQNGAVLFWQTVGLDEIDEKYREGSCRELGMEMPEGPPRLQALYTEEFEAECAEWILRRLGHLADGESLESLRQTNPELVAAATNRCSDIGFPESGYLSAANKIPIYANWKSQNSDALDQLASNTSGLSWFSPPPASHSDSSADMIDVISPFSPMRDFCQAMVLKSAVATSERRYADAIDDVGVIRLLAQRQNCQSLLDDLIRYAYLSEGNVAALLVCGSDSAPAAVLTDLRDLFTDGVPDSDFGAILAFERLWSLGLILDAARGNAEAQQLLAMTSFFSDSYEDDLDRVRALIDTGDGEPIDWDPVLRAVNHAFDDVAQLADEQDMRVLFEKLDRLSTKYQKSMALPESIQAIQKLDSTERGEALGRYVAGGTPSAYQFFPRARLHDRCRGRLMQVAIELAIYRRQHGEYPARLAEIVDLDEELTLCPLDGKPFVYRKTRDGYLLHSRGNNGVDDGGSSYGKLHGYKVDYWDSSQLPMIRKLFDEPLTDAPLVEQIPADADDEAIRMPLPRLDPLAPLLPRDDDR